MDPRQLSDELRNGQNDHLDRRRKIVALSGLGALIGVVVTFYQTGILKHLPDPPVPLFDSDRVDASTYAYKRMQTPDGALMIVTYALTACLAAAGGQDRARTMPLLSLALAAKVFADVATNLSLAREEWAENKALCAYCQTASLASIASAALVLPEAAAAWHALRGGGDEFATTGAARSPAHHAAR